MTDRFDQPDDAATPLTPVRYAAIPLPTTSQKQTSAQTEVCALAVGA